MKIKLKIRQKILLYILSVSALLYVVAIGYIVMSSRAVISQDAIIKAQYSTRVSADQIEKIFERELSLVRTLSQALNVYKDMPEQQWKKLFLDMYTPVIRENPQVYSLWDSREFSSYVPGYSKDYGRSSISIWRENGQYLNLFETKSLTGDPNIYGAFKKNGVESIWEPYVDQATSTKGIKLMVTFGSPIIVDGKFAGIIGTDVGLENLQEMVSKIKPVAGSYAFLVSNTGIIAGHPDKELIFKNIKEVFPEVYDSERILERIQKGSEFYFIMNDGTGNKQLICFAPIIAGKITTPWSLVLSTPLSIITQQADKTLYVSLGVGLGGLLLIIIVLIFVSDNLTRPIRKITNSLKRLAKGEISEELVLNINTGDEIDEMAKALNTSIEGLNQKASFASDIGKEKYDSKLELLSEQDVLAKSLIDMRNSLKQAHTEEEYRKIEDQKRTWANEGFAKFADILRQNNNDFELLCDSVIRNLVKYLGANQGGIFLWNEEEKNDQFFELVSTFAWDRKKYVKKRLEKGEGLVGACAMEKETIFMTDVPDDYVAISSGLGSANPRCVVLVPLKHEDAMLGVIEMASFNVIEKYQIEFFEKVAESIASTILAVRINARTKALLEQSQQQAEEMAAQEEEMRQNMEELQATQEEAARKTGEIEGLLTSLNAASYMVEYDLNGTITNANDAYLQRLGISRQQLIGMHHSGNVEMTEKQKKEYGKFWDDLRLGRSKKVKTKINWDGKIVFFIETYFPVADGEGKVYKVMKMSHELDDFND
ncbi:MAG: cache domain-containing protein [Tenuifilaceae bacterium]